MARGSDRFARAVTVGPIATRTTLPASGAAWCRMRFNVVKVDLRGPRSGWFAAENAPCLGEVMRLRAAPLVRKFPGNHLRNHFQNDLQKFFGGSAGNEGRLTRLIGPANTGASDLARRWSNA